DFHVTGVQTCALPISGRPGRLLDLTCRGGGIRTPGTLRFNGFQDRRIRPLCHSSVPKPPIRRLQAANLGFCAICAKTPRKNHSRSEEHTSELQSREKL